MGSWVGAGIKIFGGVAVFWMGLFPQALWGNPMGEQVVGGAASFNRPDLATLIVNQQSDRVVINWQSFSIANGELTQFVQPGANSAALNNVVTLTPSLIDGALKANGQVWLSNPNGIMVGKGGTINVGSFVATTSRVGTEEFMAGGDIRLSGDSNEAIINRGTVEAKNGDVYLIAKQVSNEGQLMARDGTVGMVSGTEVSLQAVGQGNFKVRLLAAEDGNQSADAGGQKTEGGSQRSAVGGQEAEIVNDGVIQAANAVLEAKGSYLPMAIKNTGLIEATGVRENGDGTVSLTGGEGDILNTGVVAALQRSLDGQKETGGSVLMAGKNVTSDPGSIITAAGWDGGGTVKLRAADTTILRGSIEVVGTSESAKGGQVQLLGERVGLFGQANVDASGGAGGGEVLVGGDYLGKNPEVSNAKRTYVSEGTTISVDSLSAGNGGKAIVWADEVTRFFGSISAEGGVQEGDGGFVEISGKNQLNFEGHVSTRAVAGSAGTLLLDPSNLTINNTANANPAAPTNPFAPDGVGPSVLTWATITAALAGGSVTITTGGDTGTGNGNILINGSVSYNSANSLSITAGGTGNITISGVTVANTGTGSISLNSARSILSSGGVLNAAGTVNLSAQGDGNGADGGITINSTGATLTLGTVSFGSQSSAQITNTAGAIVVSGNMSSGSNNGSLTLSAQTGISGAGRIVHNGDVFLTANTGNISLTGNNDFSYVLAQGGTVSATATTGNIVLNEGVDQIILNNVVAGGNVTITSAGLVGGVASGGLSSTSPTGALSVTTRGNIVLAGSNDFASVSLNGGGDVFYRSTGGGFSITSVTGSSVRISETSGDVIQTGAIGSVVDPVNLSVGGGANFILDNAANGIDRLAIFGNSQVLLTSAVSLDIGSVTVQTDPIAGTTTTDRGINNTTQSVRLNVSGSLTQTEPILIPSGIFAARVTGPGNRIELENSQNNVGSILLETSDGSVSFRDQSSLVVLGMTAGGGGNVGLRVDGGEVTSAPGSFGGLTGTGAINASGDGLALLGGANFRLEMLGGGFPLNDVRRIGIDMQGNNAIYLFRNAGELEIANVSANGLTANGLLGGERGFVTLTAGGDITQSASIDMQASGNNGAPGNGGTLYARTRFDGLLLDRNVTADIILNDSGNQLGNILLEALNFSGDRSAYGLIQYRDQDGFNIMGIRSAWNATLESGISDADGANTQTGPIVLGFKEPGRVPGVGAGGLLLLGERGYNLNDGGAASLGNDIDFLSADIPGFNDGDANRPLAYTDKNTFEIWWVNRDGDNPATIDPDEPIGIVSSGVLALRARDGNPDFANLDFPTVAGGRQGITLSTYDTVGGTYRPAVVQARGPITITVEDGQSLRPIPVRNTDGVFNMNFGTTLISRDTDDPDVSGITITADNMSLNGSIQALLGTGDVRTQSVILQPFTGSVDDPLVVNHNVVIGTKLGRPTTRLELLQNELRTINADTLQIQTASRTLGTAAGGPYAIDVVEDIGLIGTEAGGGVGTFRLRAYGDVNLGGRITSVANSTGATAPLNVSLNAGDAASAGQVYAKAGITTLNGFIDLAGTDILIADDLDAGTGLVALRPTRFFGLTNLIGGLDNPISTGGILGAGGGFNPNTALTVIIGPPIGADGVQAVGKAVISTAPATYGQLESVSIQDSGSGYLGGPATVTITPVSATGVSQIESGRVGSVLLTSGGSGYTSVPNVTFSASDQGGTLATGVAVIDQTVGSPTFGQVIQINITNAGTGYTRQPTVTIGAAVGAGNPAANPPGVGVYTANPATAYSTVGGALPINLGSEDGLGTSLGLLPSELALITAQTIQVGAFALDTYPLIGGASPVGHPFIVGSVSAPTFNTGRIILSDNINIGSQDLVLVTTAQVQNRFQNGSVPSTLDQALAITAGGLGVISSGGFPNYPEATVQLYGPNQIDRLALIVPNGSVALRAVNGFVGGGNFGTSGDPGAVGGVTYSATQDYRGIGIVNVGELSITSGGPVTVRERAFSGGPASYVRSNAVGLLAADLSQAAQGDAFYFEAVGGGIVGDMRQGVVTSLLPVSSIPYEYQPGITIGSANDTGGLRGRATATLDPVSGAVTAVTLAGITTGLGYTTTSAAAPSVNMVVPGIGLPVVDVTAGTVAAINVGATGSGYTSVPTVTVVNNPLDLTGAGATYTANMRVARTQIFGGGSGYVIGDVVNFVGGGGAGATGQVASVDVNGAITGIDITAGGTGYTSSPTVTVGGAGVGANVTTSLGVGSFILGAAGAGYTHVPSVALTGGGLTAASVTLSTGGGINQISLGTGYTTLAGAVAIADGGSGAGAQAIATGGISRFALAASVDGYVGAPAVTITAPVPPNNGVTGRQAQASAIMGVDTINVTAGGSGYSFSPSVVVSGGNGTGATAAVTAFNLNNGNIQILNSGTGYDPATDTLTFVNGGGAAGTFTVNGTGSVTGINLTTPGTTIDPTLAFPTVTITRAAPVPGSTDAVLAPLLGIQTIAIANTGLGYTSLPSITITDANGAGAAAAVADLRLLGMAMVDSGAGYETAPSTAGTTISIGANTLGVAPNVTSTLSTLFTSTARGANYVEPSVTYSANAGSGGVGGYVVSGFTGGVNGIQTAGGPITLSFNDLEVQGLLPAETGYGTVNATQTTLVDTTAGGANAPANITVQPATGTETGGVSVVNGLPIKGSPIPINIGSTVLPDANSGSINLSQGDLDTFIGRQLTIGRNTVAGFEAGPITVSAAVVMNPVNVPVMNLVSGGEISDLGAASGIARSGLLGLGITFRLGLDAFGDVALVGSGNDTDVLAAQTANRASNIRYVDQTGVTIGVAGDLVGVLGKTFYLQSGADVIRPTPVGNIGQESGAEIQANNFSLRIGTTGQGIANSQAVLDAENEVSDFAADLNTAAGTNLYFRNSTDLRISSISAGQPGNNPPAVSGVRAARVQIVNGGDLTQQDLSPVLASASLIISVPDGGNIILPSSQNNIPSNLIVGAVKADGTAGVVNDLNLRSIGAITVGNTGVFALSLLSSGAGYTSAPTVSFSGAGGASATAVMEVGSIAVSSAGAGYAIAPTVTITRNPLDTTGAGASAVATIDDNPLSATYGQVISVTLTGAGSNYTLAPTIAFSGGGGSGAAANATLEIANLILTASGTTYATTPTVTISGGGGTTQGTAQAAITTTAAGLAGDLTLFAGGAITQGLGTGNAISAAGNTTLTETSGAGINLANGGNNLVGTLTVSQGGGGNVTIVNNNSLALGNIGPVTVTPAVPMGNLSLTALSGSIYQVGTGTSLAVGGNSTFLAQTTAGTPNGAVILNNLGNSFGGSVAATGTRVVIRDSNGGLELGNVLATTSLAVTSTGTGITQLAGTAIGSTTYRTGPASFASAANQSIILGNTGNFFGSTVSFSALSGQLQNVTVFDSTTLDLQALNILGDLTATGAGLTQSGILQSANADLRSTGAGNALNLSSFNNVFAGEARIRSDGDASLFDNGPLIIGNGAASVVAGNLALSSAGAFSQTQAITVNGTGTSSISTTAGGVTFSQNITLANGSLTVAPATTFLQTGGTLSVVTGNLAISPTTTFTQNNGATINLGAGNLAITANGAVVQALGGVMSVKGTTSVTTGNFAITLDGTSNDFQGAVLLTNTGNNNVSVRDTNAILLGTSNIGSGTFAVTAGGSISQNGAITQEPVAGNSTFSVGAGSDILLASAANNFSGTVIIANPANVRDFALRNTNAGAGVITGLNNASTTNLRDLTIVYDNVAYNIPTFTTVATLRNIAITAGGGITQAGALVQGVAGATASFTTGNSPIDLNTAGNIFLGAVSLQNSGGSSVTLRNDGNLSLGTVRMGTGTLTVRTDAVNGTISQTGSLIQAGNAIFNAGTGNINLGNSGNDFGSIQVTGGTVALADSTALNFLTSTIGGNLSVSSQGITQSGTLTIAGATTLGAGGGDITLLENNSYGSTLTITSARDVALFVPAAQSANLGAVTASGVFGFIGADNVNVNLNNGTPAGQHYLTAGQLANLRVGAFLPVASGSGRLIIGSGGYNAPGAGALALASLGSGGIQALGPITTPSLTIYSAGEARFDGANSVNQLAPLQVSSPALGSVWGRLMQPNSAIGVGRGGVSFRNRQDLNLAGRVSMPGNFELSVAGFFANSTGRPDPTGSVAGRTVVRSVGLFGSGLTATALPGFRVAYNGSDPGGNAMIYYVNPLAMTLPGGITIAGMPVNGGGSLAGGQLNTFFTGSDNLNWMIADFGKFNLPKVEPARMEYMLYPQRVEPETRSLPQPMMRELTQELGRPPTIEEIQQREVARREALQMRTGAILERNSFDEGPEERQEEASAPSSVIDGGTPQAEAGGQRTEDGGPAGSDPKTAQGKELGTDPPRGLTPSAKKQTDTKRDANGPMLRSGPRRAVALRAEPVDAAQIIQAERERAEVGIAPPVAATPR